jgi:hypothetical protein|tara:strand:- start:1063 stop:1275 length:213 start_codon:yes stop_codon:yes gene_type:complete
MKKKIEKLLEIVERIEYLQTDIDILRDNISKSPKDLVDLRDRWGRNADRKGRQIVILESRISEIAKTMTS